MKLNPGIVRLQISDQKLVPLHGLSKNIKIQTVFWFGLVTDGKLRKADAASRLFTCDVINILKRKIAEPLSFMLSLVIEHPKHISFQRFSVR